MGKSEIRKDIVSGDWIIIAPSRAKRPVDFIKKSAERKKISKKDCPFCNLGTSLKKEPFLVLKRNGAWTIQIIENKYPAVEHLKSGFKTAKIGPYEYGSSFGHHDVIVTRNHCKNFSDLSDDDAFLVFEAFRDRYLMLLNDPYLEYISFFQNYGPKAGASIYHPHYQMLALPVLPADINRSLSGALNFYKKYKKCAHCQIIEWEKSERKRILFENKEAIVVCPYFSRSPFEARIYPKKHLPYFENTLDNDLEPVVQLLKKTLMAMKRNLFDPDYNFFIHTAPLKEKARYEHYHWHIEILPKVTTFGGFELSSGVEINPVDPNEAAKILKGM